MSITKKYDNTPKGVRKMLKAEFGIKKKLTKKCSYQSDPWVEGVWKVTEPSGACAIVYLAGYLSPFHGGRRYNDAEFSDDWPC